LADLKTSIRTKLGLTSDLPIHLAQLRDGITVVLEDGEKFFSFLPLHDTWFINANSTEDDFEAFCSAAASSSSLTVAVTIGEQSLRAPSTTSSHSLKSVRRAFVLFFIFDIRQSLFSQTFSLLEKPVIEALPPSPVASSSPFAELIPSSPSDSKKRKSSTAEKSKAEKRTKTDRDVTEKKKTNVSIREPFCTYHRV
jgi:hypothetical protein